MGRNHEQDLHPETGVLDEAAIAGHILSFKESEFWQLITYLCDRGDKLPLQDEQFCQLAGNYLKQMILMLSLAYDRVTGKGLLFSAMETKESRQ